MSKSEQDSFMQHIADRLGRERVTTAPLHPYRGAPTFWHEHDLPLEERIQLFSENWEKAGGHVQRFAEQEAVQPYIASTVKEMSVRNIIRNDEALITELDIEKVLPETEITVWGKADKVMLEKAAGADLGIVVAEYAIAETGSVVVSSNVHKGRSVSLLPTALMLLIPVDVFKTRMGEAMIEINQLPKAEMPAGIHFISGPSRSADIENDLTIGVHGPGIVYALIIG